MMTFIDPVSEGWRIAEIVICKRDGSRVPRVDLEGVRLPRAAPMLAEEDVTTAGHEQGYVLD